MGEFFGQGELQSPGRKRDGDIWQWTAKGRGASLSQKFDSFVTEVTAIDISLSYLRRTLKTCL